MSSRATTKKASRKASGPSSRPASRPRVARKTSLRQIDGKPFWRRKRSRIHSSGLFAACDIPSGTRIIEYVGQRLTKAEGWKRATRWLEKSSGTKKGAVYVFELNSRYDIDGNVPWNHARYINHSCDPNCEPRVVRGHIWIVAGREIEAGEELTYDYGYDFDHWEDHPCRCGAPNCIGYIVAAEHRPKVRRILAARKKKAASRRPGS